MSIQFGKHLKEYRKHNGWTQSQLLAKLKEEGFELWSKGTVSKWENGSAQPREAVIEALEQIFETPRGLLLRAAGHSSIDVIAPADSPNVAMQTHDVTIFKKSSKILDDNGFEKAFVYLGHNSFLKSHLDQLFQFLEFFKKEGNKYSNWQLNYLCLNLCQKLEDLSFIIETDSVEVSWLIASFNQHDRSKNEEWWKFVKSLLANSKKETADQSDDLYILFDRSSHQQFSFPEVPNIYDTQIYNEWQKDYNKAVLEAQSAYNEYRTAIRETLFI